MNITQSSKCIMSYKRIEIINTSHHKGSEMISPPPKTISGVSNHKQDYSVCIFTAGQADCSKYCPISKRGNQRRATNPKCHDV